LERDEERERMRGGKRNTLWSNQYKGRTLALLVPYYILRASFESYVTPF
jgi:hypothetical protein